VPNHSKNRVMKKIVLIAASIVLTGLMQAQTQNEKGFYVDSEGALFSGLITKTQDGVKSEFTVTQGLIAGPVNYYYASGKLMETGAFTNGLKDQKWTRYNENRALAAVAFYNLGKKTGTWLVYDDKGNKRLEMNYNNGEKTGTWTSWDERGAIVSTKEYGALN